MKFGAPACPLGCLGFVGLILLLGNIGGTMGQTQPEGQKVILAGGDYGDLFIQCNAASLKCIGTKSRALSTTFRFNKYYGAGGKLQVEGTNLCLTKWHEDPCTGDVNLWDCGYQGAKGVWFDKRGAFDVGRVTFSCGPGDTYLWWGGDGQQLQAVQYCGAWQCNWKMLTVF